MMDVGFIGLGTMGRPMAGHLGAAGYRLFVHDVGPIGPEFAAKGGVVCIIGPSGSGKSTLLRCINGLVPIDQGSIRVADFYVHKLVTDQEKIALRKERRRNPRWHGNIPL